MDGKLEDGFAEFGDSLWGVVEEFNVVEDSLCVAIGTIFLLHVEEGIQTACVQKDSLLGLRRPQRFQFITQPHQFIDFDDNANRVRMADGEWRVVDLGVCDSMRCLIAGGLEAGERVGVVP